MPAGPGAEQLLRARADTQRLTGAPFSTAQATVGWLTCVQSQDPLGANWSLAMRVQGATERSIVAAYDRGDFLRTHILRPTWHYVLPEDIRWILDLTAPRILRGNRSMEQRLGLTPAVLRKVMGIITRALEGGVHLTREELSATLARRKIEAEGQRMGYLLMAAELTGLICSGAMKGKRHTFALLDERAPKGKKVGREEGVVELLRRFVLGHAPTTVRQFSWWSGIGLTEARRAREALRDELVGEVLQGVEWLCTEPRSPKDQKPTALLVPEYDEVLTGWSDIGIPRLMADRRKGKRTNTFDRPILHGGRWVGTWRRTMGAKRIGFEFERFGALGREEEVALEREVARYAKFAGLPVEVR